MTPAQPTAWTMMASSVEATHRIRLRTAAAACLCLLLLTHSHVAVQDRWAARVLTKLTQLKGFRPIEPRISIDLPHAPFRLPSTSGGYSDLQRTNPMLAADVATLMDAATGSPRARDAVDLLLANWDAIIERLTPRVEENEAREHWLDLACAYYMRGLTTQSLNDFARGLQCLSRARPSPQVTFNRALILEQLRDREAAVAEWKAYLATDSRSAWAAEAREHLQKTSRPARAAVHSRKHVERDLLPQWAECTLRGESKAADDALKAARSIADNLSRRSGDHLLPRIISEIDHAPAETRIRLAAGFAAYGVGRRAVEQQDDAKALRELLRAKAIFNGTGSRAEGLVTWYLIIARYLADDYHGAERFVREVDGRYAGCGSDCTAIFAHVEWIRGMILFHRGHPSTSLRAFSRALRGFERLGETEQQATQHMNLADTYQYLGDAERASVHRYHALVLTEEIDDPRRLQPILTEAAEGAVANRLPAAASVFHNRVLRLARAGSDPFPIADALVVSSTLNQRTGRRAAALRDLGEARRVAVRIRENPSREKILADIDSAEAFALREIDDRGAIACLDRVIAFVRGRGSHIRLAQLLLERGRARWRLGDTALARQDFEDGISELEEQRRRVEDRELRIAYFDGAERLFSDLALLLLQRGDAAGAFAALERSRARELLDAATGSRMQPLPLAEIQRRLSDDRAVIIYTIAHDRVVAAIVTRSSLRFAEQRIREDDLRRIVDSVSRGFDSESGLPQHDLRRLHEALIAPLSIESHTRLVIVPDRFLYRVPFAALLASNGRYLVEDHVIEIAPSATVHVRNVSRDCALAARTAPSILLVADPERPEGFDALEPLLHATREAAGIAKLYPTAHIVGGTREKTILADGSGYGVIHFASHAVLNEAAPTESMLLLGAKGRLRVAQIETARFARTRLVVLSACSTGIGKALRGEGALSLARAFMSASVPSVVGTFAPVEDATAARLLRSFHVAYTRGLDPASALRHVQVSMLRSSHRSFADPARWSAFQAMGGACPAANQREERTQWPFD